MMEQPIEIENPYEDYETYEVTVVETAKKIFRCWAKNPGSAEEYMDSLLDKIDMDKDIDQYSRFIEFVEEVEPASCDYTVPLSWYGEGEE